MYYNSDDSDEDIFLNEKEAQDEHEKFVLSYSNIVKTSAKIPEKMAKLLARRNRFLPDNCKSLSHNYFLWMHFKLHFDYVESEV